VTATCAAFSLSPKTPKTKAAYSDRGDQGDPNDKDGGNDRRDCPSTSVPAVLGAHPTNGSFLG